MLIWSGTTIASGFATNFWQLFAYRLGVGIGEACLAPASFFIVADMIRPQRRGLAMGLLVSRTSLGSAAFSAARRRAILQGFAVLSQIAPWQMVFFVVGAPGLFFSLLLFTFKEPARRKRRAAQRLLHERRTEAVSSKLADFSELRHKVAQRGRDMAGVERTKKLGELVAHRITQEIIDRGWPTGELIGRESELMATHGVSRGTLREAIRQLERHGIAEMRRGPGGGLLVAVRPGAAASGALATYLEIVRTSAGEAIEALLILEGLAAHLAADRLTEEEVLQLRLLAAAPSRRDPLLDFDQMRAVDAAIIELSGNPALVLFTDGLNLLFVRILTRLGSLAVMPRDFFMDALEHRRQLVEAIVARDLVGANELIHAKAHGREHLTRILQSHFSGQPSPAEASNNVKRSEAIALQLLTDITAPEVGVGDPLGSEAELQVRYDVGRSVLREAIRMLEPHRVVEMRLGTSGGLFIGEPDPAYTIDLLLTYLRYMRMEMRHLWLVQAELEIHIADLVARRATPDVAQIIKRAADAHGRAELAEGYVSGEHFHDLLAAHSGNHPLHLFLKVMLAYGGLTLPPTEPSTLQKAQALAVKLGAAIEARDPALARRYMDETFRVSRAWLRVTDSA